jgi:hypothetical protein
VRVLNSVEDWTDLCDNPNSHNCKKSMESRYPMGELLHVREDKSRKKFYTDDYLKREGRDGFILMMIPISMIGCLFLFLIMIIVSDACKCMPITMRNVNKHSVSSVNTQLDHTKVREQKDIKNYKQMQENLRQREKDIEQREKNCKQREENENNKPPIPSAPMYHQMPQSVIGNVHTQNGIPFAMPVNNIATAHAEVVPVYNAIEINDFAITMESC